jgi:hypothetical protein
LRPITQAGLVFLLACCGDASVEVLNGAEGNQQVVSPLIAEAAAVEQRVRNVLRDPASAQYRNVRRMTLVPGGNQELGPFVYCGEINSKNGFGGFTGFQKFAAWASPPTPDDGNSGVGVSEPSDPSSALMFMSFCQTDGQDRTDATPVTFPDGSN